jgi:O-antigen/teichoic acid export membrane protein
MTELLAFVAMPVALGIAVVSRDLVHALLGAKWRAVAPLLILLALYASVRSVTPLVSHALTAVDQIRFVMWINVTTALILVISFVIGSGALLMVAAVAVASRLLPASLVPLLRLIVEVGVRAATSFGATLLLHRRRFGEIVRWARRVRAGDPQASRPEEALW